MSKNKLFLKILFLIIYRSSTCNNSISALDCQFHLKKIFQYNSLPDRKWCFTWSAVGVGFGNALYCFFVSILSLFIEICTFVSYIHKILVPYPLNFTKTHPLTVTSPFRSDAEVASFVTGPAKSCQ